MNYQSLRATVMGLGHFGGGVAAARWLAQRGAVVTVTDLASESTLADALESLDGVPIHALHLGNHPENDFRNADLVVVNPAVHSDNPLLAIARQSGARLTTEIGLLLDSISAKVIGVTGSNGKSTTAAMIAAIVQHSGRRTWLGGNLGGSLLDKIDQITSDDWVVLELSSFQLTHLPPQTTMPGIAVITNCTPNHLDWHGNWSNYVAAKQQILFNQPSNAHAILGAGLDKDDTWQSLAGSHLVPLVGRDQIGWLQIPGLHNRDNARCALTAALAAGCDLHTAHDALAGFTGLDGRLQWIASRDGRDFYNDTTSTTPESTIAALDSFDRPVQILVGGGRKGLDFHALIDAIAHKAHSVAFYGQVAPELDSLLQCYSKRPLNQCFQTIDEALVWCWNQSAPGNVILLSPACTSHDQFQNFQQRGDFFIDLVKTITTSP